MAETVTVTLMVLPSTGGAAVAIKVRPSDKVAVLKDLIKAKCEDVMSSVAARNLVLARVWSRGHAGVQSVIFNKKEVSLLSGMASSVLSIDQPEDIEDESAGENNASSPGLFLTLPTATTGEVFVKVMNSSFDVSDYELNGYVGKGLVHVIAIANESQKKLKLEDRGELEKKMIDFYSSLDNIQPNEDNILSFEIIPDFFNDHYKFLYIRNSYVDIYDIMMDNFANDKTGIAITGNPGIGKSFFLYFLLWKLKLASVKTIIVHRTKDSPWIYVFNTNRCFETDNISTLQDHLNDPSTWYLTDTLPDGPSEVKALTVVVASPARKHYKNFLKYEKTARLLYLPTWSLDELRCVGKYRCISENEIRSRYELIGGNARFVFSKPECIEDDISSAITRLHSDNIMNIDSGTLEGGDEISHLIIHFVVSRDYTKYSLKFASGFVAEQVFSKLLTSSKNKLEHFLLSSVDKRPLATLRGALFESFANTKLCQGGNFLIRKLDDSTKSEFNLSIPALSREYFTEIKSCIDPTKLYIAEKRNFPCIDSFAPAIGFFQITISLNHGINMQEMEKLVDNFGVSKIYFAVPQNIFKQFKQQPFITKNGTVSRNISSQMKKLQQYVIEIKIE